MKHNISYILILLFFLACTNNKQEEISSAKKNENVEVAENKVEALKPLVSHEKRNLQDADIYELNEKAMSIIGLAKISHGSDKDSLFEVANTILDKAIEKDSSFIFSYIHKSIVYSELKDYETAINNLERLKKIKSLYPDATFRIGILYEKSGDKSKAKQRYTEAYKEYVEYLITPDALASDDINFEFLYLLLEGKEKAIQRLEDKLRSSPGNPTYLTLKRNFQEFNREKYIENF